MVLPRCVSGQEADKHQVILDVGPASATSGDDRARCLQQHSLHPPTSVPCEQHKAWLGPAAQRHCGGLPLSQTTGTRQPDGHTEEEPRLEGPRGGLRPRPQQRKVSSDTRRSGVLACCQLVSDIASLESGPASQLTSSRPEGQDHNEPLKQAAKVTRAILRCTALTWKGEYRALDRHATSTLCTTPPWEATRQRDYGGITMQKRWRDMPCGVRE